MRYQYVKEQLSAICQFLCTFLLLWSALENLGFQTSYLGSLIFPLLLKCRLQSFSSFLFNTPTPPHPPKK